MMYCRNWPNSLSARKKEIDCEQDGQPFFQYYKAHIPSVQHSCFAFSDIDFIAKKNGTRSIRLSDNGCAELEEELWRH